MSIRLIASDVDGTILPGAERFRIEPARPYMRARRLAFTS